MMRFISGTDKNDNVKSQQHQRAYGQTFFRATIYDKKVLLFFGDVPRLSSVGNDSRHMDLLKKRVAESSKIS